MMAEAKLGHNNPPFDFFEFFDAIVNSNLSMAEKFVQIIVARKAHDTGGRVAVGRSEISRQASCSEATLKRIRPAFKKFFTVEPRAGKATEYTPKPITASEVEKAVRGLTVTTPSANDRGHSKPGHSEPGGHTVPHSVSRGASSGGHGDQGQRARSANVPPHPPKNKNIYNNPPTPHDRHDPFGLNPHRATMHADVWFDDDARLQVGNGFRVELEKLAGGDDRLRIELDRAAEWIGPNTPPQVLKSKVRGRVQSQVSEREDRDRRYERAKSQNSRSSKPADKCDQKPAGMSETVWKKIQEDKARAKENGGVLLW